MKTRFRASPLVMEFCCSLISKLVSKLLYAISIFLCLVVGATFGTLFGAAIGVKTGCLSGAIGGAIKCCLSFTKLFDFSILLWKTSDDFASRHLLQPIIIMVAFYYPRNNTKVVSSTTKIKKTEKIRITREDTLQDQNACSICLQDFLVGEKAIRLVQCQHMFHQMCIWKWVLGKRTCPLCRRKL